ncbi:MAG: DUF975 family protein [Kiritimatiellae bacterium]|nr:DUF975 family protein [Kiritimatiellia bacterium]
MITARELRERAWTKLGEGNWLKAVGAFGLFWLMGMVVTQVVARAGVATGGIENMSLADFMQKHGEMLGRLGMEVPDGMSAQFREINVPVTQPWYQVVQFVVTVFAQGVFTAGWAVFAVSVMRNGANALQVFSGFHRLFSTGWLMLLRSIRIALWSLLLFVPGIVAFYAYRMSFFLKADHPEWPAGKVLAESKRMMEGHKWRLMCLDASFIGWLLLVLVTFGLATLFVSPYMGVTNAAFYEDLLDRNEGQD